MREVFCEFAVASKHGMHVQNESCSPAVNWSFSSFLIFSALSCPVRQEVGKTTGTCAFLVQIQRHCLEVKSYLHDSRWRLESDLRATATCSIPFQHFLWGMLRFLTGTPE